jgi:hypothetical protein
MPQRVNKYLCDHCGYEWDSEDEAVECEERHRQWMVDGQAIITYKFFKHDYACPAEIYLELDGAEVKYKLVSGSMDVVL